MFDRRKTVIGIERAERKLGSLFRKPSVFRSKSTSGGERDQAYDPVDPQPPKYCELRDSSSSESPEPPSRNPVSFNMRDKDEEQEKEKEKRSVTQRFKLYPRSRKRTVGNRDKSPVYSAEQAQATDSPYLGNTETEMEYSDMEEQFGTPANLPPPTSTRRHHRRHHSSYMPEKTNMFELTQSCSGASGHNRSASTSAAGATEVDPFDDSYAVPRYEALVLGPRLCDHRRKRRSEVLNARTVAELDQLRNRLRYEQEPPAESMDGIRASMDVQDLTTAEGLLSVIPKSH